MPTGGSFNVWTWNAINWNGAGGGGVITVLYPLSIDDQTFAANWEDDQSFAANWEDDQSFAANWEDDQSFALSSYAMTKTGAKIRNFVIGDAKRIKRTYTGLPTGSIVAKAYLTIKKSLSNSDAQALAQKSITAIASINGLITDADTAGGSIAMYFDVTEAESLAAKVLDYVYDVQVELSTGETHSLEVGTVQFIKGATDAQS